MSSTTLTQNLSAARPNLVPAPEPARPASRAEPGRQVPAGTEVRGFALYVGLDDAQLTEEDADLSTIVAELKAVLSRHAPTAGAYAAVALAPIGTGGRDVDVVRLALGEPAATARHRQQSAERRAADAAAEAAAADRAASGVTIDLGRKRVLLDNVAAPLTYREFELLQFFVLREGRTVSRDEIISGLWSDADPDEIPSERTIDVHVRRLRVKLEGYHDIVRTVRGTGYRFDRHADVRIVQHQAPSPDRF